MWRGSCCYMKSLVSNDTPLNKLLADVEGRLLLCGIQLTKNQKEVVHGLTKSYVNALDRTIRKRFPEDVITVLESFDIFNADIVPNDADVEFAICGNTEIDVLQNYFFDEDEEKASKLKNKWQEFKHEMLSLKTKWAQFKKQLVSNQMKIKIASTEWSLKQIVKWFSEATNRSAGSQSWRLQCQ